MDSSGPAAPMPRASVAFPTPLGSVITPPAPARNPRNEQTVLMVFGLKEKYDDTELKAAIVTNIERTLLSLGKCVAFLGREYPIDPDRLESPSITFFLAELWDYCGEGLPTFDEEVRITYIHGFGHYLGLNESELETRGLL